ncbi:hypothetical protein C0Q70_08357 [Pomacea canaliculata]|uniref:Uncharacterized protein n=1 Tax=Pomacea canaliculata TaxID=400727 RepID=A0A2T7PHP2_POMCA|nr:hypothetical protein C0Q70_08357 [Pomacea canaliculata]
MVCSPACDPSSARCVYGNVRSSPTTSGDCCDCNYGFTGSQCDRCDTQIARCLNGGTPNTYPTSGQCGCSCPPGYTGTNCEQQGETVRCVYGNVRTTPTASGDCCDCNYGFTGSQCDLCDTRINRCQNGGTPNAFLTSGQCGCTCLPGYTGTYCEQRQCDIFSMNCQNGGYPAVQNNQCACTCPAGFTGSRCEQCSTQPNICQNGGTVNLIPINGQCGCRCLAGYTGLYCETALCSSNTITCENGGTPYLNTNNGQCACSCLAGFSGPTCGRGLCTLPCGPNSSPDRLDNLCTRCVCNPGWTGLYCNTPVTVSPPTTSTELCSASESPCLNGQPAYRDCNGRCICRCDSRFYTGPNCEYRVEPKLCDNCLFQNGNYLAPVQGRCDLFVVCQPTNEEQTEFIPWVQSCPAGTMFQTKGSVMGCIGFGEGVCSSDPCQTLGVGGRYAHATECARYYECSNQVTAASQCCPAGQSFDARTQQCVNNPSCVNTCAGTYRPCDTTIIGRAGTEEFCPYRARPNNESFYYHLKAEAFSYPCGLQRIFNSTSCLCQDDPRAGCGPTIDLPFDTSSPNKSVPLRTVAGSHGRAGYFDGTSRVVIYRYSNSGFYTDYFLMQFRVKPTSVAALGAGEVALVSNGDCGVTESLGITLSSNYVSFKVQQEGSSRLEVLRVPYSPSSDWLDIKFVYERLGDGLYSFTGTVNGQSQSLEMTSVIATRACALHIAQGQNYRNLDGYVDDFQIWMCKPSTVFG